ncbi:ribonuclease E [Sphingobium sp. B2D3A]|uniref:Rne/Rng family ribonuclease n=1 Tax=unclassified Sphingobium TaxID=2611147 RepID=UPI002224CBC3|nr:MULTISPECIES: ribonuclease E/G [unclassified Sphingobium]MCW2336146.1 ribonuclease E [Sphingobium sp. B2D3A]MCW2385901.1 ribonuclease E [Sphingobium sp. B2D3D]
MTMRMLIDARHREETRVAVVTGNRIEEFDFESAEHKQLKGNIYLAKVTRVEPSLQAAFVDYGGNRHGFLAFSEIHPDYYQIPREDREALLAEEAAHAAEEAALRGDVDDEDDHGEDGVEVVERPNLDEDEESEGEAPARKQNGKGNEQAAEEVRRKRMALRRRYKIQDVIKRRQVLLVQIVKEERGNKGAALTTYLSLAGRYCVLMPNTSHGGGISRKISNGADRKRLKSIIAEMKLPNTMGCIVRTAGLSRTKTEIKRDFDYLARLWDEIRENTLRAAAPELIHNDSDLIKRAIRDIYHRDIEEVIVEGDEGYRQAKDFMKLLMPSHARRVKQYADPVSLFQRFGVEDQLAAMYNPVVQLKSGGYLVINPTEALVSIDINSGRSTREHSIEQTATATNLEAAREIARQLRLRDMAGLVVIDFIDMEHNSNIRKVEKAMKEALKDDRARIQVGRISGFGLMEMSRQRLRTGVLEASTRPCPHCEGTGLVRTASSAGLSALRMLEEEAARGRGSQITLRASQEAAFYVLNNKRRELDEIENRYGVTILILPDGEIEGARMSVEASGPRPTMQVSYAPVITEEVEGEEDEIEDVEEEEEVAEERQPRADDEGGEGRKRKRRRRGRRGRRDRDDQSPQDSDGAASDEDDDAQADADERDDEQAEAGPPESSEAEGSDEAPRRGRRGRRGGRRRRSGQSDGADNVAEAREGETDDAADAAPVASVDAAEAMQETAEPASPEPAEQAEEAPAPKRRRRTRKAAEATDEAVTVEVSPELAETPTAEAPAAEAPTEAAEEAPAPKRRTRRKTTKAAETPAATEGEAQPEAEASTEAAEEAPKAAPKPRARRKPKTVEAATEARETLVADAADTATDADASAQADGDSAETPRRGWWQRTFGA